METQFQHMARMVMTALVSQAMEDLAVGLACELGYESIYEPVADDTCPGDDDIAHALREPVSGAAIMNDLCLLLGIEPPAVVRMALDAEAIPVP